MLKSYVEWKPMSVEVDILLRTNLMYTNNCTYEYNSCTIIIVLILNNELYV